MYFLPIKLATLVKTADGDWRGLVLFGFFTGLRLSDAANLTWDSIDLEKRLLRLRTRKTGIYVTIPLHSDLLTWLARRPRGIGKAPLFPTLHGQSGAGKSGLSSQFKRIMEKARIGGRILRAATGEGRKQSSLPSIRCDTASFQRSPMRVWLPISVRSWRAIRIPNHTPVTHTTKLMQCVPRLPQFLLCGNRKSQKPLSASPRSCSPM